MPTFDEAFPGIVAALADRYGRPEPGAGGSETFAKILAAYLERTVEPRKVASTLEALREAGLLEPDSLAGADPLEIAEAVKQAPRALQRLARWVVDDHEGSVESLQQAPTALLREELLGLNGIGPASADAILLNALRRPVYPVDRATYRILVRHGWLDPTAEYDEARDVVESQCPDDPDGLFRLSAWLERVGREACRPSVWKCERCPLRPFLPDGGPREPE
jgi:endonuclease-3 related protein